MQGLILKESGWHLIPDVPEEPTKPGSWAHQESFEEYYEDLYKHNGKLQQAISSAIPVQYQKANEVSLLIWKIWSDKYGTEGLLEKNKIYPVEVSYEIKIHCDDYHYHSKPSCKVAILHPPKEVELVKPDLGEMIAKVHNSMEGRYDLTEEDLHTIHYLLGKLQ